MAWTLFPIRTLAILGCLLALAVAAILVFSRPDRAQNRSLGAILVLEAVLYGGGEGFMYVTDSAQESYAWQVLAYACLAALPLLYVRFWGTLETPWVAWLRRPWVRGLLGGMAVAAFAAVSLGPGLVLQGMKPMDPATDAMHWTGSAGGPLTRSMFNAWFVVQMAGLAVTWSARRHARSDLARRQATVLFAAFLVRDLTWSFMVMLVWTGVVPHLPHFGWLWMTGASYLAFVGLLGYGILKAQMFDIDLKLKWTLKQAVVAGVFFLAFFGASEGAEAWVSDASSPAFGLAAAGLLALATKPIERQAQRLVDRLMPAATGTPDYLADRKAKIYQAAVEGALRDGVKTVQERSMLEALRNELGLSRRQAARLEQGLA